MTEPLSMSIRMNCLTNITIFIFALISQVNTYGNPVAALDYGTFQGKYDGNHNLWYFRKIPFAAPPTGENRF